ncbi:bifunctional riboflavin kinase/FAD synthetase [Candidatus Atelocyanobacterium thalassae]|uniref:Riboflavin biosynthesis protein n=1 Tax=Atelocyanobacterium thalassa (isolate ALOHA) TaxID=1453429 RepID=D3EP34_ATETH|nr:bifunctional riboflavin kinase/FAD synthetase [Candidatus Atelocyanobacterium thalassa]ADB95234.1 FMN adenylyltransferase /riboflavin kinase [Candidatus Atelocyanobacterium thalassa isolate ALOHA]MCH2543867.1 bifunctional riboflavin kinase/FAD synthetase [Candidatus Atelocyanobacterium sp. ALOHA_A2.5_9]|tara:strand:+ start:5514 stop:6458 length:945 start_codon:yes stop_codon:yes gene_type:complete
MIYSKFGVWIPSSIDNAKTPTAVALGNFDGIHLGHRQVLKPILKFAKQYVPTVVTFEPHPQEFFTGETRQLLTPIDEKVQILNSLNIKQLIRLPFNQDLASLSPLEFIIDILVGKLNVRYISVGENFYFGHKKTGTVELLRDFTERFGISVNTIRLETFLTSDKKNPLRISSSKIREYLADGSIAEVNQMLGYSYFLRGIVISGQQIGRTIGFPTANLKLPTNKLLPCNGVYCVYVEFENKDIIKGVMNVGKRPTIDGSLTVEVHLLDWSGNLYGKKLTVYLEKFLRYETKFPSLQALRNQIEQDCKKARSILI